MTKEEFLQLIDLYNSTDEIIFVRGGRALTPTSLDHETINKTGKVAVSVEWIDKEEVMMRTEHQGSFEPAIKEKKKRIEPRQAWLPLDEYKYKYQVEKKCPWAVKVTKYGQGWMAFESMKDHDRWNIRIALPKEALQ